jgi:capsular polysaccharide biosynthesis protein
MKDPDQSVTWDHALGDDLAERLWAYEDPVVVDDDTADDPTTGLVGLRFLGTVLRRGMWLWCGLAVAGLLIGSAWYASFPPAHKASATVLLIDDPNQDPTVEVQTDIALAQSTAVADGAISQLGLRQTPSSFLGTYTVALVTDHVLTITASAKNSAEAVRIASAVATQFLKVRAQYSQAQLRATQAELAQQVSQAQQNLNSINSQVNQVSAEPSTQGQQSQLHSLKAQSTQANIALVQLQEYATVTLASTRLTTQDMVKGSEVLNAAAPAQHSILKSGAVYAVGGLLGGLILGMAIVIIGGVTSDRLRRRDDIAYAIGAPVRLSVGPLDESRWLPRPLGRAARRRDLERVVEHLGDSVPGSSRGPAGLAVVAVDDVRTVAGAVVALAVSTAKQGRRVVLADLSAGASMARLLGADRPGISTVGPDGTRIVTVVPTADAAPAPVGPLRSHTSPEGYAQADDSLVAVCDDADLLLSLVTLDPALGAEHLATWATDAVAVITAGLSTGVRIHAVGEMVRLAGTRLSSVVVIDADKRDESLGAANSTTYETAPL